jgi:SAM-dependent methyltransferase
MNPNEWAEKNYALQSQHEAEYKLPMMFWMPDGVDTWLHNRKYEQLLPLTQTFSDSSWLTIGDGRYGSDAYCLLTYGVKAVASSISDVTLKEGVERGYIKSYKVENAEDMKSADGEYDFVLCKESYHHFPRPPLALYEMLRVASKAVVLIEPLEGQPLFFDWLKGTMIKKLIRGDQSALYEPSGNFIYRISIREIEKMMTAINNPTIAVRLFNTFYHPRLASQKYGLNPGTLLTKLAIFLQDMLSFLRLMNYGLATIIVFKTPITAELRNTLQQQGFSLIDLPKNPYLS